MDTMPSSKFRKRYATLPQDTLVTVNGHVIGKWMPMGPPEHVSLVEGKPFVDRPASYVDERYDQRPVTAVPKGGKRS